MPIYYVKTADNRVTVVEADYYDSSNNFIDFYIRKEVENGFKHEAVASFQVGSAISIVEENAYKGNFDPDEYDDDDSDDVCLDCRIKDVVNTDEFFEAVWDIVDAYHDDRDEPQPAAAPEVN